MTSTYLGYQLYANDYTKSLQRTAAEPTAARDQQYYLANIGKVTSVDQFVNNYRLLSYATTAFGLQDLGNATAFLKKILESDLSDPKSFANQLSDTRYRAFAKAYQFTAKGLVTSTAQVQTSTQLSDVTTRYAAASTASADDQTTATTYFQAKIGKVTSVAALESDPQLYNYVLTAYGIDPTTPVATVTQTLESDLSDAKSFANTSGNDNLLALAGDFNFSADGKVSSLRQLQSAASLTATTTAYTAAAGTTTAAKAVAATETTYYQSQMPQITSVDAFLRDSRLVAYAEKAYGLPATTSTSQLKAILSSDLTDPKSTANKMGAATRTFAAAFNVTKTGTIALTPNVQAQSKASLTAVTDAYLAQTMESEAGDQNEGVRLALYFRRLAPTITNAFQILADPALTKVAQTMLGLSPNSSKADIDSQARTITSKLNLADLKDPKKLDQLVARFAALYDLTNTDDSSTTTLLF